MCFSAAASFTASGVLVTIGLLTLRKTNIKHEWLLASIPFLFAIQQFTEGVLWLSLKHHVDIGTYWPILIYSIFVGIIWPILVPLGILLSEKEYRRRLLIIIPIILGTGIGFYSIWSLTHYGVTAQVQDRCILYETNAYSGIYVIIAYLMATCAAFFFSSHKSVVIIGIVNVIAFFTAFYFYRVHLTSIWCFFAAAISVLLYLHFTKLSKNYL